jgi:hypothetical protein
MTSCAPRLAEMNANPQIHEGIERPERKKSVLVLFERLRVKPTVRMTAKYTSISR